jgi:hypothetical protein
MEPMNRIARARAVTGADIAVDYVETNAYWASDRRQAVQRLRELAYGRPRHRHRIGIWRPQARARRC